MERNLYQEHELEAYLGDHVEDFDMEAIVDEATETDYSTGNRYWKDGIDLAEICERHDRSTVRDADGNAIDYEAAVNLMDDDLREELHAEGIDDPQEFLERYAEAHAAKFGGEEFAPYHGGAW